MKGLELARLNTGPFSLALHIKFHRHCSVMWLSSRSIMLETTEIRGSSVLPFFRMRRGGASFLQMLLCHMGQILLHAAIAKENYPESEKGVDVLASWDREDLQVLLQGLVVCSRGSDGVLDECGLLQVSHEMKDTWNARWRTMLCPKQPIVLKR